jgi:hypothetical protein
VRLDPALLAELRSNLAAAPEALVEARKLAGMTEGRFPLEWHADVFAVKLGCQDSREVALLLRYEALVQAHEGNVTAALDAVRGILACGRAIGDEPTLISMLVRMALGQVAANTLERVLAQGEPSAKELEAVQGLLQKEAAEPLLLTGFRGERAAYHEYLEAMKAGSVSIATATGAPTGSTERGLLDTLSPSLARRSHAEFLRLMTELVEAAKRPPEEQAEPLGQVERKVRQAKVEYDVVVGLLMPAYFKPGETYARDQGALRCAIVAVALERYRLDHDRWPETLAELTPKYLAELPTDPGDGKALRCRRVPDGVVVYWVGIDRKDNGGAFNRTSATAKQTDLGFRLWNPERRHQPPAEVLPPPAEQ